MDAYQKAMLVGNEVLRENPEQSELAAKAIKFIRTHIPHGKEAEQMTPAELKVCSEVMFGLGVDLFTFLLVEIKKYPRLTRTDIKAVLQSIAQEI
jgi:hypothetical protein